MFNILKQRIKTNDELIAEFGRDWMYYRSASNNTYADGKDKLIGLRLFTCLSYEMYVDQISSDFEIKEEIHQGYVDIGVVVNYTDVFFGRKCKGAIPKEFIRNVVDEGSVKIDGFSISKGGSNDIINVSIGDYVLIKKNVVKELLKKVLIADDKLFFQEIESIHENTDGTIVINEWIYLCDVESFISKKTIEIKS